MKKSVLLAALSVLVWMVSNTTAYAWDVSGHILCPTGVPYNNVTVNVTGTSTCEGLFTGSTTTNSGGSYFVGLPNCAGSYKVCIDTTTLPAGASVSGDTCVDFELTVSPNDRKTVNWEVSSEQCQPPCPDCVAPELGLGNAAGCTVLELDAAKVSVTGPPGGILGDVCVGPNGSLAMSGDEFVTGTIKLGQGAKFSNSSHGAVSVAQNVDLSAQISAAYGRAASAAGLTCTQSYTKLDGKSVTTITGVAGTNVICVDDVILSGKQVTLTGPAGAQFIINVTGKFVLTGGGEGPQIRVEGGVEPKDVLYNIIGAGADIAFSGGGGGAGCCAAIVDGTLLAPLRKINLSPGLVNGQVISGKDISIVSGAGVRCQCPRPQ